MLTPKLPLLGLLLACAGCIAEPSPPPLAPVAVASPPAPAPAPQPQCREFQQTVMVGGQPQQGYGTTCLQADGSWQIVQPATASPPPAPPAPVAVAPAPYAAYPYPAYPYPYSYPYPYYGYPGYVGPSVGFGVRVRVH